jgi:putative transcriptional regulator
VEEGARSLRDQLRKDSRIAHEMAKDLFEVGAMDEVTMRTVESLCLPAKKIFLPEDIRRIRTTNHLSQPVFALMFGIGKTTVQQWVQGVKKPGCSRKLKIDQFRKLVITQAAGLNYVILK